MTGIQLVAGERSRQLRVEGRKTDQDVVQWPGGELAVAAACYAVEGTHAKINYEAVSNDLLHGWPLDPFWDKRSKHSRIRRLAIAGALIAAEIDRLVEKNRLRTAGQRRYDEANIGEVGPGTS